jgi:hypothetical protein
MTWVQRACGLLKVEGLVRTLKRGYLDWGRECFMEANNDNRSKSLLDMPSVIMLNGRGASVPGRSAYLPRTKKLVCLYLATFVSLDQYL